MNLSISGFSILFETVKTGNAMQVMFLVWNLLPIFKMQFVIALILLLYYNQMVFYKQALNNDTEKDTSE